VARTTFSGRYKRFCQLLADARQQQGLTQVQLAQKLRKPQSFVSKYETGERRLDVVEFMDIAKAIGISHIELLDKL